MRTLPGLSDSPRPLAPWLARQRRASVVIGSAIALALAAVLVVRARMIADDPAVEVRLAGTLSMTEAPDDPEPAFVFALPDGLSHPVALLGVRFVPSHRAQATERIAALLAANDDRVLLTFDPAFRQSVDSADRIRAYVYLRDARMLNELLIAEGLARADRSRPHVAARTIGQTESLARRRELGLWERVRGQEKSDASALNPEP